MRVADGLIAGVDPADPTCSDLPVPDYIAALDGDLRGQRIGVPTDWFADGDPAIWAACRTALQVMRGRGATSVALSLPLGEEIVAYGGVVARVEASALHAEWMRAAPQRYAPHVSARLYPGYAIPATFHVEALSRRPAILAAFVAAVFGQVDALLLPTLPGPAPDRAATDIDHGPAGTERAFFQVGDNVRPFNYLGLPAISFPVGLDARGVPIGAQLVGRPFGEARLLRLVDAYQRDTGIPPAPAIAA